MADGSIRIRSNVVTSQGRWDLVPGDLLGRLRWHGAHQLTSRQHDERMYYKRCAVCRRDIATINLTGCLVCREAPSPTAVDGALDAWCVRVDAARSANQNSITASHGGTPSPESGTTKFCT